MYNPRVIAVVLNYNRREDTLACLGSLRANSYENLRVIVLDNASTDGSVAAIRAGFPEAYTIELAENRGYAGNNNVGIRAALEQAADWVFVINEDTVLDANCVSALVAIAESDTQIGIVGPAVYHFDEPGVIQSAGGVIGPNWESCHLAQNEADRGQFREPREVDWISGCGIMLRREVIEQVGSIDERYFYYWEETEWCIRAHKAGWRILNVPQAKLWHKGVQRDYRPKPLVTYYATRNRLMTLAKHRAPMRVWFGASLQLGRTLASWSLRPRWRRMREHKHAMWRGVVDFVFHRWGGPVQL